MNIGILILGGFAGTLILSALMAISRPLGLSRVDLPFLLGSVITPDRNKAPWVGFIFHLVIGWTFSLLYGFVFEIFGISTWWFGMGIGFLHGLFVLSIGPVNLRFNPSTNANPFPRPYPTKPPPPPRFFATN